MFSIRGFSGGLAALLVVVTTFSYPMVLSAAQQYGRGRNIAAGVPARFHRLAGPQNAAEMPCEVVNADPEHVQLTFTDPPITLADIEAGGEFFSAISMDGEGSTLIEGAPDLPRVARLIMIGRTGNVELSVSGAEFHTQPLAHTPYPYKRELTEDEGRLDNGIALDPAYYGSDAWYPAQPAEISPPMVLRDVRFVLLMVYPVQVNPVTGEMRVYDQLDVQIENTGGVGENEISFTPEWISPSFKRLYESFLNFPGSALDALPVMPGKHLYICQNNATVLEQVDKLVTWRRKKGIDAYRATTTETGASATQLRAYIQNTYNASGGTLEYVTMVGDPVAGPPYGLVSEETERFDNYFAALSGGPNPDPMQDLAIGRIPCSSAGNLAGMVSKIIAYESTPYLADTTWLSRASCISHTFIIPSNPSTKEYTRQIMLQEGLAQVLVDTFDNYVDAIRLAQRANAGVCVMNHRLSTNSQMQSTDISGVLCGRMNPFVCTISCGYGWFTISGSAYDVTKQWVRMGTVASPNGAIGCVGMATTSTWVAENNILDGGMMYSLFALDVREQGLVLMSGELQLFRQFWGYGQENDVNSFTYWANLMGDPATPVQIGVPQALTATYEDSLRIGDNQFSVAVQYQGEPAAGCLVGLLKGTETFARGYTDANGLLDLPVNLTTTGWVYLTVTRGDLIPKLDSVRVVQATQWLAYSSTTVDDDALSGTAGDGDGILNPGETVDLSIRLRNSGNALTATGVSATISSTSPGITVLNRSSGYPNIAPGTNQPPNTPFRIHVGAVFDGEPVQIYLTATSSAGTQLIRVDLTPRAGNVAFTSATFPDGNNRIDPGDTGNYQVTFTNSGVRSLGSAAGILRSLDARVTVNDSLGSFGSVANGANGTNGGNPFNITASALTYGGLEIPLELVVTDTSGFRDSVDFLQLVGISTTTSPTGPDGYGYYAYDNTETQPAGSACTYDWVEIAPARGGPGFALNLADAEEDSDQVVVQTLPFAFQFYGQSYTQITICTNGWVALGAYNIDDFRNYRILSPIGPPNMICAYWDDLRTRPDVPDGDVYVYSDLSGGRYIVEWITRTLVSGVDEVFEVILHSPVVYPSVSGDGKILVQYQDLTPDQNYNFNDNDYATVGIQNEDHTVGLEYSWYNTYPTTATALTDGRAIMYTTDPAGTLFSELTVTVPNGGEVLMRDSVATLAWYPASVAGNVNIELSRTGALGPYTVIAANVPNDGIHNWTVTGPSTNAARIRVVPIGDPAQADTSNGDFAIAQIVSLISEDFEDGAPDWTHSGAGGSWVDDWHVSTEQYYEGTQSYKCGDAGAGDYRPSNDAWLLSPVISDLPPNAMFQFVYQINSEISTAFPDSAYDGGIIELALDGGAFTQIAPLSQYPRTFRWEAGGGNPATGPMRGYPCFAGDIPWSEATFDLSSYAGSDVQLRFRFGSDLVNNREGWYVDNVQVYAPAVLPTAPIAVTIIKHAGTLTLRWLPDGNSNYRIYSSDSEGGALTLVGSSATTSFVIADGGAAAKKFYVVTGWDGTP